MYCLTLGHACTSENMSLFDGLNARWIIFSLDPSELISSFELTTLILIIYYLLLLP